jgi:ubiquitin thioesterase OTU1
MRIRLRGPLGASVILVNEKDTVGSLLHLITEKTGLSGFEVKYGYPPKPLELAKSSPSLSLADLGVKLDGEQLTVSPGPSRAKTTIGSDNPLKRESSSKSSDSKRSNMSQKASLLPLSSGAEKNQAQPLALTRKAKQNLEMEPPELPVPEQAATILLRIMPDDNSCIFRAFGSAYLGSIDSMTELRSLIAQTIQQQPETYSAVVLEQTPDDYCIWIQTEEAWGGGIELSILSQHFDLEICSIDVQSLRVDKYNEGRPSRCILVYSGIHYDTIALSPSEPPFRTSTAPPELDIKIFDSKDDTILYRAVDLCRILKEKHYYTDTASFNIVCNECGMKLQGERGASTHASATGHTSFGEA